MPPIPNAPVGVAVSGGADSLYCLISLKEKGIPVIALHGHFIPKSLQTLLMSETCEADDTTSALAEACDKLGVPFHSVDCSEEFTDKVIIPFVTGYSVGETPNPCALCNAAIKLHLLLEKMKNLGAKYIATGHYARSAICFDDKTQLNENGISPALYQGADPIKDQSYFLALVKPEHLASTVFPLGNKMKSEIIATLKKRTIKIPTPKESQEICFIPNDSYQKALPLMAKELNIPLSGKGAILLNDGQHIGNHNGLWQYTEGQRRGLGIGWKEPLYVIAKDNKKNVLRVGTKDSIKTSGCLCGGANIIYPQEFWPTIVYVKTRYKSQPLSAHVQVIEEPPIREWWRYFATGKGLHITFLHSEALVAKGQLAAVYIPVPGKFEDDKRPLLRLVAGGIITETVRFTPK